MVEKGKWKQKQNKKSCLGGWLDRAKSVDGRFVSLKGWRSTPLLAMTILWVKLGWMGFFYRSGKFSHLVENQ